MICIDGDDSLAMARQLQEFGHTVLHHEPPVSRFSNPPDAVYAACLRLAWYLVVCRTHGRARGVVFVCGSPGAVQTVEMPLAGDGDAHLRRAYTKLCELLRAEFVPCAHVLVQSTCKVRAKLRGVTYATARVINARYWAMYHGLVLDGKRALVL